MKPCWIRYGSTVPCSVSAGPPPRRAVKCPQVATVEFVEAVGIDRQAFEGETDFSRGDGWRAREVANPPQEASVPGAGYRAQRTA